MQQGAIFERGGMWYLQSWRTDFVGGRDVKRLVAVQLVQKDGNHRNERDVRIRCAQQLSPPGDAFGFSSRQAVQRTRNCRGLQNDRTGSMDSFKERPETAALVFR